MAKERLSLSVTDNMNEMINACMLIEYNMTCNRIPADQPLPSPPPVFSGDGINELMNQAKRVHDSLMRMLNDNRATKAEIDRFTHLHILRVLAHTVDVM